MTFHKTILISLCLLAFGQSYPQSAADNARVSDPQKSFALLKTLAGTWQASITTPDLPQTPREEGNGAITQVVLRITSRGNAIVHEVHDPKVSDDPTRYDHPISVIYLDNNQLNLIHYCDAGNRPHMRA